MAAAQHRDNVIPHRRMYQAAKMNRLTQDWIISVTSANAEILVSRKAVISRTQQLERDNPIFQAILRMYESNVIGPDGIQLHMNIRKADGTLDRPACAAVKKAWERFGRRENCTIQRTISDIELQELCIRALARDGGILLRKYPGYSNGFSFAVEPIDIARLDHDLNRDAEDGTNEIRFGIEYDKYKAPVAYHILARHPGEVFAWGSTGKTYRERVPAASIIPVWAPQRPGQLVGMPLLTGILNRLNMLDKYDQAECVAAFIASCKGGFFTKKSMAGEYEGQEDIAGNTTQQMEPGMIEELPLNWEYQPNDPQHPTEAYPYFVKTQLRSVAAGAGVPYNDMAADAEGVNFSSMRSAYFEPRQWFRKLQRLGIEQVRTPLFEEWLGYALIAGQVEGYGPGDEAYLNQPVWNPRSWPYIDPLKDIQASLLAIQGNLSSLTRAAREDGEDIEEIFQEKEAEKELAEEHGIDLAPPVKPVVQSGPEDDGEARPGGQEAKKTVSLFA